MPPTRFSYPGSANDIDDPLAGSENEDPNFIRNPYYMRLAQQNAALKGLQLANDSTQQKMDLADPEKQVATQNDLIARHQLDSIDQHGLDVLNRTLGAKNAAQLDYEGDPRHLESQNALAMGKIAPALAVQQLKNDAAAAAGPKMDAQSKKQGYALENAHDLAQQILPLIDQIDSSAKNYRGLNFLQKLPGVGYGSYQNYLYNKGMPVDDLTAKLDQLVNLNQAMSIAGMTTGRPSAMWIDLLKKHLGDSSQPLGEIRSKITDMDALIPGFLNNLKRTQAGDFSLGASAPNNPGGI